MKKQINHHLARVLAFVCVLGFALSQSNPAPEFSSSGRWFNSAPLSLSSLRGKVVLLDFFYGGVQQLRTQFTDHEKFF